MICVKQICLCLTFCVFGAMYTICTIFFCKLFFYEKSSFCFIYEVFLSFYHIHNFSLLCSVYAYKSFFGCFFFAYRKFPNCAQRMCTNLFLYVSFSAFTGNVHGMYDFFPNFDISCEVWFLFHVGSFRKLFYLLTTYTTFLTVHIISFQTSIFYFLAFENDVHDAFYFFGRIQIVFVWLCVVISIFSFFFTMKLVVWIFNLLRICLWLLIKTVLLFILHIWN